MVAKKHEKLNKSELISLIAEKSAITKKQAEDHLNEVIGTITDILAEKNDVALYGFGTFAVTKRAARMGHNPSNGEQIKIPAKNVVSFKPAKILKEKVNAKATRAKKK